MEKEIQITMKIRSKDMFWFMMHHTYSSIGGILSILFSLGSLGILIGTWKKVNITYTILLAICALLFTIINPILLYLRSMKQVLRNKNLQKPILYCFTKDGFTMQQEKEQACAKWNELWKVIDTKHYIFLYGDRVHANILAKDQMEGKQQEISKLIKGFKK